MFSDALTIMIQVLLGIAAVAMAALRLRSPVFATVPAPRSRPGAPRRIRRRWQLVSTHTGHD